MTLEDISICCPRQLDSDDLRRWMLWVVCYLAVPIVRLLEE